MTSSLLAVLIAALVGALAVWVVSFSGFAIAGWVAALVVTLSAVTGGVIGTGLLARHDEVKPGPAGTVRR